MKTYVITGATQGIGRGIALQQLKAGNKVIAIGSSVKNGRSLVNEARALKLDANIEFLQANLSLISENERVIESIKSDYSHIDGLILCAAKHSQSYTVTRERFETTLALVYLSRYKLTYGLQELLEKGTEPFILNFGITGLKGDVNWDDLGFKKNFAPMKVMLHGSLLNDLLAVQFVESNPSSNIHYILHNPGAVKNSGMDAIGGIVMKIVMKLMGKTVDKAIKPIGEIIANRPADKLISFTQKRVNPLTLKSFNKAYAKLLDELTKQMLG